MKQSENTHKAPDGAFIPSVELSDIARCIYTLCTGRIIAKIKAVEWG